MDYQAIERYDDNKDENFKRKVKVGALIAVVGAAYVYGRSKGFDKGFDIGHGLGELQGFKDAVKSITEGSVDLYNLGGLEE